MTRSFPHFVLTALLAVAIAADAAAYTLTWKGGSGPNWSTPANWVENAVPMNGDSLRFQGDFGDPTEVMVNDLPPDTEIASINVTGRTYRLSGNRLALGGDITAGGYQGWIEQRMLWGVYPGEAVD